MLLERARSGAANDDLRHEIFCLSGRLAKDRAVALASPDPSALAESREAYRAAHAIRGDPYPGVNAATLSLLLGDTDEADRLASEIVALLESKRDRGAWEDASLAEAQLLVGCHVHARASYVRAIDALRGRLGSAATVRRQLALLAHALPAARTLLEELPFARVIAFSGHMVDRPERALPRFPASLEPRVASALRKHLKTSHGPIVYTSAACGADLLFIEAALDVGAEVNIVLPFARDEFVEVSVAYAGASWVERFDRVLARATRVILATNESYLGDDVLFDFAEQLVEGLAFTRARQLETEPNLLCVLDDASSSIVGGTQAVVARWIADGLTPDVIDLRTLRETAGPSIAAPTPEASGPHTATAPIARPQRTIKTMLFADIAGFGRLHDSHAPLFHARFLGLVSAEIASCRAAPLLTNTWGDALYAVFDTPEDGATFALGLRDRMRQVDWSAAGLSDTTQIRIALHAGAVFCGFDSVIGRDNYFGTSVTMTARVEPVTPPGVIYATEAFVATLAARRADGFTCDYVGVLDLAKKYGESRLYALERTGA